MGLRTSEEVYHQLRWDPAFSAEQVVIGCLDRPRGVGYGMSDVAADDPDRPLLLAKVAPAGLERLSLGPGEHRLIASLDALTSRLPAPAWLAWETE